MFPVADRFFLHLFNAAIFLRHPVEVLRVARDRGGYPDIACPSHQSERLLWRKLFDHNPLFPVLADKVRARDYVAARCPDIAAPELLWSHADAAAAAAEGTSADVVIKANHGCDMNLFPDGTETRDSCESLYRRWLATDYSARRKEWCYRDIPRRIFAERRIRAKRLVDILVHCCDGKTVGVAVIFAHKTDHDRYSFYRPDGSEIGRFLREGRKWDCFRLGPLDEILDDPSIVTRAMAAGEKISAGLDYARIDFMSDGQALFSGEITFYHRSGYVPPAPRKSDNLYARIAANWDLRQSWFVQTAHRGWRGVYARALGRVLAARARGRTRTAPVVAANKVSP